MKLWEINWKDRETKYKMRSQSGEFEINDLFHVDGNNLFSNTGKAIQCIFNLKAILEADFEPVVDWSKVEVDTPIILPGGGRVYFSHYQNGFVYYFGEGRTSWSSYGSCVVGKKDSEKCKLAKIGEDDERD